MQRAFIEPNKCLRCNTCHVSSACPVGAVLRIDYEEPSVVESDRCHGCGDCMPSCPAKAVVLKNG